MVGVCILRFTAPELGSQVESSAGAFTRFQPTPFSVVWSEDVQSFVEGDVTVTNGAITTATFTAVDAANYAFSVDPVAEVAVTVQVSSRTVGVHGVACI